MYDVYVIDLDHPTDQQGRPRMRMVADTLDDPDLATAAGNASCYRMLESAGAFELSRGHVVTGPAYPNHGAVAKTAVGLGGVFADMVRFWVHDHGTGALAEHRASTEALADLLGEDSARESGACGVAAALGSLATVADQLGNDSRLDAEIEAVLRFLATLSGRDWTAPPISFPVHRGVAVRWTGNGPERRGWFSVVLAGGRAQFRRTGTGGTALDVVDVGMDAGVDLLIADAFRTGVFPGEDDCRAS